MTYGLKGTEQFARSLYKIIDYNLLERFDSDEYAIGWDEGRKELVIQIDELLRYHTTDLSELGSVLCKLDCERRNKK